MLCEQTIPNINMMDVSFGDRVVMPIRGDKMTYPPHQSLLIL